MNDYSKQEPIEGHLVGGDESPEYDTTVAGQIKPQQLPATRQDQLPANAPQGGALKEYNPLQALPADFKQHMEVRKQNYDALKEMLRDMLVAGKDYGRIHVVGHKSCDKGQWCKNPSHFSGNQLFSPGGDKILSLLGLAPTYPGIDDYRKATLRGIVVSEVVVSCKIVAVNGQVVATGDGAASVKEHRGDLSNTIKKAKKRARMDGVLRLPGVSSLFEDDYFETAANTQNNGTAARQNTVNPDETKHFSTGADLTHIPMGKFKDKLFSDPEVEESYLRWMAEKLDGKPDISAAASKELRRRETLAPVETFDATAKPTSAPSADDPNDDLPPLDSY